MNEKEPIAEEPKLPTPGQLLKNARIGKGLSVEQVANKINLRAHNIDAIEQDRDDSNLSMTFTRGYLKLYAKFVDVDETDVLEAFERVNSVTKEPAKLQSFSRRVAKQTSDARLMMLTYAIIGIVIALSVVWWLQQSNDSGVTQVTTSLSSEVAQTSTIPENTPEVLDSNRQAANSAPIEQTVGAQLNDNAGTVDDNFNSLNSENEGRDELEDSIVADVVDEPNSNSGTTEDAPSERANEIPSDVDNVDSSEVETTSFEDGSGDSAVLVELIFEFADDCWVSVIDSIGETRAIGVKKAGYVMNVPGVPPFEVTLGAPQAVQISMAGEAVDMSQFPAGRTARFELPVQE